MRESIENSSWASWRGTKSTPLDGRARIGLRLRSWLGFCVIGEVFQANAVQLATQTALNRTHLILFVRSNETVSQPGGRGTGRTADAVDVVVRIVRNIVVDD